MGEGENKEPVRKGRAGIACQVLKFALIRDGRRNNERRKGGDKSN